ncbi:hypothetical protein [Bradyrhizobium sp. th.b2]|nr:hypothetical protein [Bradyrhizobium sp. th.b2]
MSRAQSAARAYGLRFQRHGYCQSLAGFDWRPVADFSAGDEVLKH